MSRQIEGGPQQKPGEYPLAESSCIALEQIDSVMRSMRGSFNRLQGEKRITARALYRYITSDGEMDWRDGAIRAALRESLPLRREYLLMLERSAKFYFPKVAAASSGLLQERSRDGYRISLRNSQVEDEQLYVIIELPAGGEVPSRIHLLLEGGEVLKVRLPEPVNNTIQLLQERGSPLVRALQHNDRELFFC